MSIMKKVRVELRKENLSPNPLVSVNQRSQSRKRLRSSLVRTENSGDVERLARSCRKVGRLETVVKAVQKPAVKPLVKPAVKHVVKPSVKLPGKPGRHQCDSCDKTCGSVMGLKQHMKTHQTATEKRKSCDEARVGLKRPLETLEAEPEQCTVCGKEFTDPLLLREHCQDSRSHSRPFSCSREQCGRLFSRQEHLAAHQLVHPDPRPHQCPNCRLHFSLASRLTVHSSLAYCSPTPEPTKSLQGSACRVTFSRPDLLELHRRLRHQFTPSLSLPCAHCSEVLDTEAVLARHEQSHLTCLGEGGFLCPERGCREVFSLAGDLELHRAEHREAAVSCRECGRAFGAQLDMLLHRLDCEKRSSKSEEETPCASCDRRFSGGRLLAAHLAASRCGQAGKSLQTELTKPAGFSCDSPGCGKVFEKPVLLRNHLYSHTDSPFHCSQGSCSHSYRLIENYRSHCGLVHDGRMGLIACDSCDEVFTVQSHLDSHKENIHKEVSYDLRIFEDELPELDATLVGCPFCSDTFKSESFLRVHLVSAHPPPWSCRQCGEELTSLLLARQHVRKHKEEQITIDTDEMEASLDIQPEVGDVVLDVKAPEEVKQVGGLASPGEVSESYVEVEAGREESDIEELDKKEVRGKKAVFRTATTDAIQDENILNDSQEPLTIKEEVVEDEVEEICDPEIEAEVRMAEAARIHLSVLQGSGCPAVGDFARAFGISANSIQLMVIPEVLEPGQGSSLSHGLAVDLYELSLTKGVGADRLLLFLTKLLPSGMREPPACEVREPLASEVREPLASEVREPLASEVREPLASEVRERVVARLAKVRVQASRFRARYSQLPTYLDTYLPQLFNPFL